MKKEKKAKKKIYPSNHVKAVLKSSRKLVLRSETVLDAHDVNGETDGNGAARRVVRLQPARHVAAAVHVQKQRQLGGGGLRLAVAAETDWVRIARGHVELGDVEPVLRRNGLAVPGHAVDLGPRGEVVRELDGEEYLVSSLNGGFLFC